MEVGQRRNRQPGQRRILGPHRVAAELPPLEPSREVIAFVERAGERAAIAVKAEHSDQRNRHCAHMKAKTPGSRRCGRSFHGASLVGTVLSLQMKSKHRAHYDCLLWAIDNQSRAWFPNRPPVWRVRPDQRAPMRRRKSPGVTICRGRYPASMMTFNGRRSRRSSVTRKCAPPSMSAATIGRSLRSRGTLSRSL